MNFLEVFTMKMTVGVCIEFSDLASKRLGIFFTISPYTFFLHGRAFRLDMLSPEGYIQYVSCLSIYLFLLYFDVHTNTPRCWCVWV